MSEEVIELVKSKILSFSGIYVADSQLPTLEKHIKKQSAIRGLSPFDFVQSLNPHTPDFDEVINLVTVNETYFFREEKQFDFLKEEIFPKYMGKNLTIWSCCCSSGEEPISLLALALSMNVNLTIYASDIDDTALEKLHRGSYSIYSLRTDGQKYHKLLEPYSDRSENEIIFRRDFINRIHAFKFNLIQGELSELPFYENADIIFMRNVFIYFDKETRALVTRKITSRLKQKGLLLFSMNEIGSIDKSLISENLYKTNSKQVYYFVNDVEKKKTINIPSAVDARRKVNEAKKQKLLLEVEKAKNQKKENLNKAKEASVLQKKEIVFDARQTYEGLCLEINRGNFEKARTLARAISGPDTKKYVYFMLGYVEYQADNRAAAETLFASAESISSDFWPAFFYHGMVLRDMGRNEAAQACFSKCKALISDFGTDSIPYDFTLDSFSPSYIYSLCETFSMVGGQ